MSDCRSWPFRSSPPRRQPPSGRGNDRELNLEVTAAITWVYVRKGGEFSSTITGTTEEEESMEATLNERFIQIVGRRGGHTAFKVKRNGAWQEFDFDWALEEAAKTAFGLQSLGYEPGSRIAILSENRPEWATTDFGAMAAGFVGVPKLRSRSGGKR